jgi:hypothetical protein
LKTRKVFGTKIKVNGSQGFDHGIEIMETLVKDLEICFGSNPMHV